MLEILSIITIFIFWKPIYYSGRYIYHKFYQKDDKFNYFVEHLQSWFIDLAKLVW